MSHALPYFADFAKIASPILRDSSFIVEDSWPTMKTQTRGRTSARKVVLMTVCERVLAIRLLEQQEKKPEYFEKLGVQANMNEAESAITERRKQVV